MTRIATSLLLLSLASTAFAGGEAYFVKVDRETTTQMRGDWHPTDFDWDARSPESRLVVRTQKDGSLRATIPGGLPQGRAILGWSGDGGTALIGVEPDEIDFDGGDPGGTALVGVEPDEIDFDGGSTGGTALVGLEPDEIDVSFKAWGNGDSMELRHEYAAYVVLEVATSATGAPSYTPVGLTLATDRI